MVKRDENNFCTGTEHSFSNKAHPVDKRDWFRIFPTNHAARTACVLLFSRNLKRKTCGTRGAAKCMAAQSRMTASCSALTRELRT